MTQYLTFFLKVALGLLALAASLTLTQWAWKQFLKAKPELADRKATLPEIALVVALLAVPPAACVASFAFLAELLGV